MGLFGSSRPPPHSEVRSKSYRVFRPRQWASLERGAGCPRWVKSRLRAANFRRPLFLQQRTFIRKTVTSALCQYLTYRSMLLHVRRGLNQKRLCLDLVHEDDWNSMRCFAFYGTGNPCAPVSPSALLRSVFTRTYGGCAHATGQTSFEAETHNQSRRREGAGCRRTEFFAGGWCIRIHDAHCRYPAI
jgi:hypothetical protein